MKAQANSAATERLLTLSEVAAILGTSERFPRRLIAERRIEFVKVGRHVRIRASVLDDFIASGVVAPITARNYKQGKVA
jgi:excisionase family DNA binding protein